MSTDLSYDDVYGEKKLETSIEKQGKRPLVKRPFRTSMRKSRFGKRKAHFALVQEYKEKKRELNKKYLQGDKKNRSDYIYHITKLRKEYGIAY